MNAVLKFAAKAALGLLALGAGVKLAQSAAKDGKNINLDKFRK